MEKLLVVNGIVFPETGNYNVSVSDKVNEYESESGSITVEIIRENIYKIDVSYGALPQDVFKRLSEAVGAVNEVTFYDPIKASVQKRTMKADKSRIKTAKQYYKNDISVWSLSFALEEM